MFIITQSLGIIAVVMFALSLHQKNKIKVLIFSIISNFFNMLEYLLLNALSAVGTNIVDIVQAVIFYKYAKRNEKVPLYWIALYSIVLIIMGYFTYQGIISIFPIVLAITGAYAIWQDNLKVYRLLSLLIIFFWMVYNFSVSAYVNALGNIFQFIMGVIAVYRFKDIKFINNIVDKINNRIKKS